MHHDNNMPRRTRRSYEMHSKHKSYIDNIKLAQENISNILESKYKPVIEYSGGKDSLVLLHMVMQQDNTIPIFNFHPGYGKYSKQIYRTQKTHNELMKSAEIAGAMDLTVVNTPFWNGEKYLIGDYFPMLFDFMKERGCDLELLGIRGGESVTRKHRVKGPLIRIEGQRRVAFPIRHLTVDDIWSYIITNDLYYISHYDKYAKVYGYENARFTSLFNENNLDVGGSYFFDKIILSDEANEQSYVGEEWWTRIDKLKGGDTMDNKGKD